ncbi:tyrosine-protein phosphatase [Lentibacillus saliphilus]|uniref:tyrosine-protein phosphatase n=1 Tax=Lentibacillus saliphilus TaxID=2737028 RepID=UPI001C2F7EDA|nr:CpsB/CapC family capsule biosynthesis tyrosine phosphatase [Lentibacillus saliphilus]
MIDIHRHILPGFADGQTSMAASVKIASQAAQQGITSIIATPHHPVYTADESNAIYDAVEELNHRLADMQIPVVIQPGQGTRIHGDIVDDINRGEIMAIGAAGVHIMLELPHDHVPDYTTNVLFDMQIAGYVPVLTQPERNDEIMSNPDKLYRMVKNGALVQIGAANLAGKGGGKVSKFVNRMIDANLAHFIATGRQPRAKNKLYFAEAYQQLKKNHDSHTVRYFHENIEAMMNGYDIQAYPPERMTQKKFLFFKT